MAAKLRKGLLRDRINRVGVELEGGWYKTPTYNGDPLKIERDGSVKFEFKELTLKLEDIAVKMRNTANVSKRIDLEKAYEILSEQLRQKSPQFIGEIPSPALVRANVEAWMRAAYPPCVNETCGLHVHMSFKGPAGKPDGGLLNYQRLMTPDFTTFMVKALLTWAEKEGLPKDHPIWKRIQNPKHEHCAHIYLGDAQSKITKKDWHSRNTPYSRYTAINYCLRQHKTVECRLLPMMETPDQGIRAVNAVLDTTNRFLSKVREKERAHKVSVPRAEGFLERREIQV